MDAAGDTNHHVLVGGHQDEQDDAAVGEVQLDGVGHHLQRHGNGEHDHVIDHQVDVQHIPAGQTMKSQMRNPKLPSTHLLMLQTFSLAGLLMDTQTTDPGEDSSG